MKIARSSKQPLVEAPMVSLADIAFLMIFFFLASSNFMKDPLSIELPEAEKQAQTSASTTVVVGMGKNNETGQMEPHIFLDGDRIQTADLLEAKLKDVFQGFSDEGREVQFKCDKGMAYKDYSPVLTAIGNAGGAIAIIHEER